MQPPLKIYTYKDAIYLFNKFVDDFMVKANRLTYKELQDVVWLVNNDINLRDWFLLLPDYYDSDKIIELLEYAIHSMVTGDDVSSFNVLLSMFYYESGNKEKAYETLQLAIDFNPKYPLTIITKRCFDANWTKDQFNRMRIHLQDTNMFYLTEHANEVIEIPTTEGAEHV